LEIEDRGINSIQEATTMLVAIEALKALAPKSVEIVAEKPGVYHVGVHPADPGPWAGLTAQNDFDAFLSQVREKITPETFASEMVKESPGKYTAHMIVNLSAITR
jgi:hypothetical protein